MPSRTIALNLDLTWPEPITVIKSFACGFALTAVYKSARTGRLPSPPTGFTWRGIIGGSILVGGVYSVAATMAEGDAKRESTSRDRLVMTRWIVGGLGLTGLGIFMLGKLIAEADGAGCHEAVCPALGILASAYGLAALM